MSAYATIQDAIDLYGSDYVTVAFDRDGDGSIDTAAANLMLEVVSAEADSYMVGRVGPLPLENVPLDLKMRCIDLAIYRMCPSADRLTNEKVDRFKAAIEWFKMVAENKIKLAVSGEAVAGSLTQKARLTTANEAACEQDEGSRWFSRRRTRVLV